MPKSFKWNCPTHSSLLRKAALKTLFAWGQSLLRQRLVGMCSRRDLTKVFQQSSEEFWEILCRRKVMVVSQLIELFFFCKLVTEHLLCVE